jgi:hypothetical protein
VTIVHSSARAQVALDAACRKVARGRAYDVREVAPLTWDVGPVGVGVGLGAGGYGRVKVTKTEHSYTVEWEGKGP